MPAKSKLIRMEIYNLGCIGQEGVIIDLDNLLCLVGPNNSGKSTVLRAYELAVNNLSINDSDKCNRCTDGEYPTVILHIHIPEGTPNIDENWKIKDGELRIVKSRWVWDTNGTPSRSTWDPHPEVDNWSTESKASGLDTVFSSRLPVPFRIGALDDPKEEHNKLLTLILQPIADELKTTLKDDSSPLADAIKSITRLAKEPVARQKDTLDTLKTNLNRNHNDIFPNLKIDFSIDIGDIKIDPTKLLLENSNLSFSEWEKQISWEKQGTGSQRALFWAMLQVRSELKAKKDAKTSIEKIIAEKQKAIDKLKKEIASAKKPETRQEKENSVASLESEILALKQTDVSTKIVEDRNELSLPGYMLLIDEPEIALHPNAIRAASRYLYSLSKDDSWQVILSTHSLAFINPLEDHTTIVRLERSTKNPKPQMYRSDRVKFEGDEKEQMKLLNRFDMNIAEMFFGQYPIIVEGDTEYACFDYLINTLPEDFPLADRPILVRAHGKYSIITIIKMLSEFKVDFSVIHDSDYPLNRKLNQNGAWTANTKIFEAIKSARSSGSKVIHRVSIPYFEYENSSVEIDSSGSIIDSDAKEKPWNMLACLKSDPTVRSRITDILKQLSNRESIENNFGTDLESFLRTKTNEWARINKIIDPRIGK